MPTRIHGAVLASLLLGIVSIPAHAVIITYDLASLGGNQYRYDYTLTNDGSITNDLALFDILFDPSLYDEASLSIVSDSLLTADWDQLFLGSGIGVPAAFDALALGDGLSIGETVAGFSVSFAWLGADLPGAQAFEVYDPSTFDFLGGGTASLRPATSVPEPDTLALFALGLAGLGFTKRKRPVDRQSSDV